MAEPASASSTDAQRRVLVAAADFTPSPPEPAHVAISGWIQWLIANDVVAAGDKLPPERDLARALKVSRMTLRQALGHLDAGGQVVRTLGARGGTFIAVPRPVVDLTNLVGLRPQLLRSVESASSEIISMGTVSARPVVAKALRLPESSPVHVIVRLRYAADVPVVLERSFFPAVLTPGMLDLDLSGSLYELLRERYRLEPATAVEDLVPILLDPKDAELLRMAKGRPALQVLRSTYTRDDVPVEYSVDIFRGDRLRITVSSRVSPEHAAGR